MLENLAAFTWFTPVLPDLEQSMAKGKLAHGVLLTSREGLGVSVLAGEMARLVLCDQPRAFAQCDCPSCHFVAAQSHPDYLRIAPEEGSSVVKIAQVQQAVDKLTKTAQRHRKVLLIEQAHTMNINASNALLKTLEEPSGDAFILLVTDKPGYLLPTIKSRVQVTELAPPSLEQAKAFVAGNGIDTASRLIVELYMQRPCDLLELALQDRGKLHNSWLQVLSERKNIDVLKAAKSFASEDLEQLIAWWIEYAEHAIISAKGLHRDYLEFVQRLYALRVQIRGGSNPNKQLALETLFMDWFKVSRWQTTDYSEMIKIER